MNSGPGSEPSVPDGGAPRLLFLINEDLYFCTHRLSLALAARAAGCEVLVATRVTRHRQAIESHGFELIPVQFERGQGRTLGELNHLLELVRLYRRVRPELVHHISLKHAVYGSVAARLTGVPAVVNTFAGLGYLFVAKGRKASAARVLVGWALRWALAGVRSKGIFQNREDRKELVDRKVIRAEQSIVIRGSGVDTTAFVPFPEMPGIPRVLLASRMIWPKGIAEFVEAARILKSEGIEATFSLAGMVDLHSPAQVPESWLQTRHREGIVEWLGLLDDMPSLLRRTHIVVLPTYYGEGLPKILLEAASAGRPIITTNIRGCRDVVRDGVNGLLIPQQDPTALAGAIRRLVTDAPLRIQMGERGREIVEREFSSPQIVQETLGVYRELLGKRWLH